MHIIMKSQKEAIAHKVVRFPFKAKAYLGPPKNNNSRIWYVSIRITSLLLQVREGIHLVTRCFLSESVAQFFFPNNAFHKLLMFPLSPFYIFLL